MRLGAVLLSHYAAVDLSAVETHTLCCWKVLLPCEASRSVATEGESAHPRFSELLSRWGGLREKKCLAQREAATCGTVLGCGQLRPTAPGVLELACLAVACDAQRQSTGLLIAGQAGTARAYIDGGREHLEIKLHSYLLLLEGRGMPLPLQVEASFRAVF